MRTLHSSTFRRIPATTLADVTTRCFLIGALMIAAEVVAMLFPREIPLRKRPKTATEE
jgi:hypothetical protein